jgi:hypothetical protein
MLIKSADDRHGEIHALEELAARPDVPAATRKSIEHEIWAIRGGMKAERDAAYEIDFHYARRPTFMVIHDLRLEFRGRVAQIDHLLINRLFDIWVCESKAFAEGVRINEHGEWFRYSGERTYGMPSPVEQNRRHIAVLRDVLEAGAVTLPRRVVRLKPNLVPVVLVANRAKIDRPAGKAAQNVDGLETVIKVEQLVRTIERRADQRNIFGIMVKLVGADTIERLARELVAMHRPLQTDWAARFGLPPVPPLSPKLPPKRTGPPCDGCGQPVTAGELAYSTGHSGRFAGRVLCYLCQQRPAGARAKPQGGTATG